jgi:toxin ParE1/3/4
VRRIDWSAAARRDFRDLVEWLSDRNAAAADDLANAIEDSIALLGQMPRMGRVGRVAGTRELIVPRTPYIVIYKLSGEQDQVIVVRVLHTSRKWPPG